MTPSYLYVVVLTPTLCGWGHHYRWCDPMFSVDFLIVQTMEIGTVRSFNPHVVGIGWFGVGMIAHSSNLYAVVVIVVLAVLNYHIWKHKVETLQQLIWYLPFADFVLFLSSWDNLWVISPKFYDILYQLIVEMAAFTVFVELFLAFYNRKQLCSIRLCGSPKFFEKFLEAFVIWMKLVFFLISNFSDKNFYVFLKRKKKICKCQCLKCNIKK